MSMRQILILGVALVAAIAALFLVRAANNQPQQVLAPQPVQTTGPMILVAAQDMPAGETAQPADLKWAPWPQEQVNPAFIQQTVDPQALEGFVGAVARVDVLKGEPVTPQRLVKKGDQGFFAAMLTPGYRAVALPISSDTAAAGFIMPNDRVDIILTRKTESQRGDGEVLSDVVLENVRVLTIGAAVRAPPQDGETPKPLEGNVATVELSPRDAEVLAMSRKLGDVSLALRALAGENARLRVASAQRPARALEQTGGEPLGVRVHGFGSTAESAAKQ
jgi:pilus assembly protein CpaB